MLLCLILLLMFLCRTMIVYMVWAWRMPWQGLLARRNSLKAPFCIGPCFFALHEGSGRRGLCNHQKSWSISLLRHSANLWYLHHPWFQAQASNEPCRTLQMEECNCLLSQQWQLIAFQRFSCSSCVCCGSCFCRDKWKWSASPRPGNDNRGRLVPMPVIPTANAELLLRLLLLLCFKVLTKGY